MQPFQTPNWSSCGGAAGVSRLVVQHAHLISDAAAWLIVQVCAGSWGVWGGGGGRIHVKSSTERILMDREDREVDTGIM